MCRFLCLCLYYGLLRWLPPSDKMCGIFRTLRFIACRRLFAQCGHNANIDSRAYFGTGRCISIGDNSAIGINSHLHGQITIGTNVMMGPEVLILTRHHEFSQTTAPMIEQGYREEQPVVIKDDVWIGARVVILPGVTIGHGVIIGAGAVVTKSIDDWSISAGNPARVIRNRRNHRFDLIANAS